MKRARDLEKRVVGVIRTRLYEQQNSRIQAAGIVGKTPAWMSSHLREDPTPLTLADYLHVTTRLGLDPVEVLAAAADPATRILPNLRETPAPNMGGAR